MEYIISVLIGYFLGCSNMAYYLAKFRNVDLSSKGSGNPGTSNAVILMGWRAGILVGVHDIGKAVVAIFAARILFPDGELIGEAAGAACVIGHIFPVFFKFRGGKGFASFIGMMLALNWKAALVVLVLVVIVTVISDYLVLGTTLAVVSFPIYRLLEAGVISAVIIAVASIFVIYVHKTNYIRIAKKTEIGLRSTVSGEHRIK